MNNNQTVEKLRQMHIGAMAELHLQHVKTGGLEGFTPDEYLGLLIDHEWENRQNQKIERLLKQAAFRQKASVEDIRFEPERNLDRNMFNRLATLDFVRRKENLLIMDDFGLQALDNHSREALMDIIDDRYNKTSTIIVSQIPVSVWYDIIGEGTIADAILDRIVNSSHRIDLKGESMRKGILKNEN